MCLLFLKQKTADEMRISDWSSDVCSSDLGWEAGIEQHLFDSKFIVGATWFDRTTMNQIIYNGCSSPSTDPMCFVPGDPAAPRFGYYLNVARSEAHGVEAAGALTLGGLTVGGNYSWILRSEGPRVGKECDSTCRYRLSRFQ